jgi:protein-S-isoprenylcysteine O-methyltransferase Ste14
LLCRLGAFFFRVRNGLFPALFLAVMLAVRPSFFAGDRTLDAVVTGLGFLAALLGEIVRCLTIGLVYIERGGRNRRVYASTLVTEGIYAHTRNPMYVGNLLLALGFCLMYGAMWAGAVAFLLFLLIYIAIVWEEERFLRDKFGAGFEEYCRDTNRFLPRLHGLAATMGQHRFDWKRVITKEYGTLFSYSFGTYVLLVVKYRYLCGPVGVLGRPGLLLLPVIPIVLLYAVARYLKKSDRLRERAPN